MIMTCAEHSICFEIMKGLPTAYVALTAALLAAMIAYQQFRVARAKLNLDLFDSRYAMFELVWGFLSDLTRSHDNRREELGVDLTNSLPKIEFLMGKKMAEYVQQVLVHATEYERIERRTRANQNVVQPGDIDRHTELTKWLFQEASQGARKQFGPFLDFERWR